jgi:hypothetical protein
MRTSTPLLICFLAVGLAGRVVAGSPQVSVSAPPGFITNENQESVFTLTLSAPASRNIGVTFVMTGSAAQGFEYALIGKFNNTGQAVIPAGKTSVAITLHTLPNGPNVAQETATLNILNGTRYHIGFPNHATILIRPVP